MITFLCLLPGQVLDCAPLYFGGPISGLRWQVSCYLKGEYTGS